MALPFANVDTILTGNGTIRFRRPIPDRPADWGGVASSLIDHVGPNFYPCKATINVAGNTIELRTVAEHDTTADAVNVVYEGAWARYGDLQSPGYMYSDSFSGCEFFLYPGFAGAVTGVHASKESGKVVDPSQYFKRRGEPLPLWHWQSQGTISTQNLMAGWFGAVFLVVDVNRIDCYALGMKNQQVMAVIEHTVLRNWQT
jgi:hypothetical protein